MNFQWFDSNRENYLHCAHRLVWKVRRACSAAVSWICLPQHPWICELQLDSVGLASLGFESVRDFKLTEEEAWKTTTCCSCCLCQLWSRSNTSLSADSDWSFALPSCARSCLELRSYSEFRCSCLHSAMASSCCDSWPYWIGQGTCLTTLMQRFETCPCETLEHKRAPFATDSASFVRPSYLGLIQKLTDSRCTSQWCCRTLHYWSCLGHLYRFSGPWQALCGCFWTELYCLCFRGWNSFDFCFQASSEKYHLSHALASMNCLDCCSLGNLSVSRHC